MMSGLYDGKTAAHEESSRIGKSTYNKKKDMNDWKTKVLGFEIKQFSYFTAKGKVG